MAMPFGFFDIGSHYGQGLGGTLLPLPQRLDRIIIRSIACQKKPPQAFNGHDSTFLEELTSGGYSVRLLHFITLIVN
jgi:hypothetical protein